MRTNGSIPAKPRRNPGLWPIGQLKLRFPAERVWTLGPPGYTERLPGGTDLSELCGIVVVVALLAEDIVDRWETTVATLRIARERLARETLVAIVNPGQIPHGVMVMAEKLLPVPLMASAPPPRHCRR